MIMSGNAAELNCPRCGAVLDASVANGICPACLLKQVAMGTGSDSLPAMAWEPPLVVELATAFPQLEVLELIGHGGMGAVYKARQKSLGRLVALKILAPQLAANPDFASRFAREAKVLAEVCHPNIVTVHDFGRAGETGKFYFLTMEFVDGVNLRQAMTAGRLTPSQALAIIPPICEALQFAHDRGIVHRDIKPENLLLDKDGRIKIADFGIARMLRCNSDTHQNFANNETTSTNTSARDSKDDLTQESVLGTPSYMAPEQRDRPASVDHRADIFSLGVVLYEMLTGERPGTKLQPPSRRVEIDVRLDEIVLRALEQQPELRFQSATEFRTRVSAYTSHDEGSLPGSKQPEQVDWTLWSPSQSSRVAEICKHLTREEKRQVRWMGAFFGVWNAATFFLPCFAVMFLPQPLGWILGGLTFITGLAFYPLLFKMQRESLLNTIWARQQKITFDQIRRRKWTRTEIAAVAGAATGIAGLIFITLVGWERVYAAERAPVASLSGALIVGIIGAIGVWMEMRRREKVSQSRKTFFRPSSVVLFVALLILCIGIFQFLTNLRLVNSISANAFIHPSIEGSHFSLQYEVECPTGWNVWVTLENSQLFHADDPASESGVPVIISRYQAKLTEHGQLRIPLEYIPVSEENRDRMLDTIGPEDGWKFFLAPKHDVSLLFYTTESLMRVWAIATILPEGLTPDSLLGNEPTGSPRYKTIESLAPPKPDAFGRASEKGRVKIFSLRDEVTRDSAHRKLPKQQPSPQFTDEDFALTFSDGIFVMDKTSISDDRDP